MITTCLVELVRKFHANARSLRTFAADILALFLGEGGSTTGKTGERAVRCLSERLTRVSHPAYHC